MRTRGCRQKDVRGETGRDTRSDGGGENTTSAVRATAKRFSSTLYGCTEPFPRRSAGPGPRLVPAKRPDRGHSTRGIRGVNANRRSHFEETDACSTRELALAS